MTSKSTNMHRGSTLDEFLAEEGILEEVQTQAVKEVVAWQLSEAMKSRKLSKARLATLLNTSRTQVDRLLDPTNDVTISSLQRAAAIVGRKLRVELV
jgi:antitoxin HicB